MWTPGERRGALMVAALLIVGAGHDVWRGTRPPAPPPQVTSGPAAVAAVAGRPVDPDSATRAASSGPLDLNDADARSLDALPGIGPVLAERILAERRRLGRFERVEDLLAVPGIGPRLFERLSSRVRVGPSR